MKRIASFCFFSLITFFLSLPLHANPRPGKTVNFDKGWRFHLGDVAEGQQPNFDDSKWRILDLPHDWSIEGEFAEKNPATPSGGALPGGIGWYRKSFHLPASARDKSVFIEFDGVYRNSEVWINGHYLGQRPYGYSAFEYELSPYLEHESANVIAVRVDNSQQPNSRWYSGSGVYRNVWMTTVGQVFVKHWGTYVTTPRVTADAAEVALTTTIQNRLSTEQQVTLNTIIYNSLGKQVASNTGDLSIDSNGDGTLNQKLTVKYPVLWTLENPSRYKAVSEIVVRGHVIDRYETQFGIRTFFFDREKGFFLNGKPVKIRGVCNHHDLGALGAAINTRALERQLEILKAMGVNGIRTSHNPPAPELLELADRMGFIVMDEAFDVWKKRKARFDYHLDWDEWHQRDLEDMVLRDRNHPSVFIWSIGNEIKEQSEPEGADIARELAAIVRHLDPTRPIISAMDRPDSKNNILSSGALDLIGYNYHQQEFPDFLAKYPGQKFIATETTSALETRGSYEMPSDVIKRWPVRGDESKEMNTDYSCPAYDNTSTPWGSTHEETWKIVKKYDFLSGLFIWTGFDYLGEPTPYHWPARSSYFGIVDLAGFPKDSYYMYQSEWTNKPVLHILPHWNWAKGQMVDVWAYTNAEEVELFLNGKSLGVKRKVGDDLHLMWRTTFEPGTLRAVARTDGRVVLTQEVRTAGRAAKIILIPDRKIIKAGGNDLSFVTVKIVDENGTLVPYADNLVQFQLIGEGSIAGVDNGSQTSHEPFEASRRNAFNGMGLAILRSKEKRGRLILTATGQ
ncbi:MAG TPA: beta-galactosidase GalB, partial [Pyrinomonadaceae bacterium]